MLMYIAFLFRIGRIYHYFFARAHFRDTGAAHFARFQPALSFHATFITACHRVPSCRSDAFAAAASRQAEMADMLRDIMIKMMIGSWGYYTHAQLPPRIHGV